MHIRELEEALEEALVDEEELHGLTEEDLEKCDDKNVEVGEDLNEEEDREMTSVDLADLQLNEEENDVENNAEEKKIEEISMNELEGKRITEKIR